MSRHGARADQLANSLSRLSIDLQQPDGLDVLVLTGELDAYTVRDLREQLEDFESGARQLVLDLSEVRLLDSAGLGALVALRNLVHHDGGRLGLVCSGRYVQRILQITGLRSAFALGEDLAEVQVALNGGAIA